MVDGPVPGEGTGTGAGHSDLIEVRRALDAVASLADVSSLATQLERADGLQKLADLVVPKLADACSVQLDVNGVIATVAIADRDPERAAAQREIANRVAPLLPTRRTAVSEVLQGAEAKLVPYVTDAMLRAAAVDEAHYVHLLRMGYRSAVVVPLAGRDGVLGTITFSMVDSGRRYVHSDLTLLGELARRAAIAIENGRLLERAARAAERTKRLQQLASALSHAVEVSDVASIMVTAGCAAAGSDAGYAWLLDESGEHLEMVARQPREPLGRRAQFAVVPVTAKIPLCNVIRTLQPEMYESSAQMDELYPGSLTKDSPYRAWTVIPLAIGKRALGGITFSFANVRTFSDDDREMLVAMAGQASIALERARLDTVLQVQRRQLDAALERAREADRRKDQFLAMLGHELRGAALENPRDGDVFQRHVTQLTRMIDDLLELSSIAAGKVPLVRATVEIGEVLAAAIEKASPLLEKRKQRLFIEVQREGLLVDADADRLAQVFTHLLANAAKYTAPRGAISITATEQENKIVIEVSDNGIGIPDEQESALGIGLTIARSLCELHGGTISGSSPGANQGSTFTVRLPRAASRKLRAR